MVKTAEDLEYGVGVGVDWKYENGLQQMERGVGGFMHYTCSIEHSLWLMSCQMYSVARLEYILM